MGFTQANPQKSWNSKRANKQTSRQTNKNIWLGGLHLTKCPKIFNGIASKQLNKQTKPFQLGGLLLNKFLKILELQTQAKEQIW